MKHVYRTNLTLRRLSIAASVGLLALSSAACGQERRPDRPPRNDRQGAQNYSIEQAVSDNAQLHTIAFSGLAFMTGDFGACTFLPPGKVCDYFGFQYMRDIDAAQAGHNPKFLDRVAANVLYVLSPQNRKAFEELARKEAVQMDKLARMRLPLIKAFCRQLSGNIPSGSKGLNKAEVSRYVGEIFAFDAEIALERAKVFGQIAASFSSEQKAYLAKMKFGDYNSWPAVEMDQYKLPQGTEKAVNVAYMSCASEFFSWYAGSTTADVYFCPERHGTYFGGFYMKDMPAMGKRDYNISTSVTGDSGRDFLNTLTETQRKPILAIPDIQRSDLNEIVAVRKSISAELRKCLQSGAPDSQKVINLGRRYGELDGNMSWLYAMAFSQANETLTNNQRAILIRLRDLDGYISAPYYIYSDAANSQPNLPSTDHFFFAPKESSNETAALSAGSEKGTLTLKSSAVGADGVLPVEFTGDGASISPPLEWTAGPKGTNSYAVIMHHIDPEGKTKWYWTLYNIPSTVTSLPKGSSGVGTLGNNSINSKACYAPPHSKGPGTKVYVISVYALSSKLEVNQAPETVSRAVLLEAMKDKVLGSAELQVSYTRNGEPVR